LIYILIKGFITLLIINNMSYYILFLSNYIFLFLILII